MSKTSPAPVDVPHGAPVEAAAGKQFKQGHSFLGCLCDMRRAVIILNIIGLGFGIVALIAVILIERYNKSGDTQFVLESYDFWTLVGIQISVILAHVCGIMGAVSFSICPILITILVELVYAILSALDKNWIGFGASIFVLYPHVVLCYELAKGIMTKQNYYEQERQSCCCV